MKSDGVDLDAFKEAVFNAGVSPGRGYVKFFADAMRWPVDRFASRTVSDNNRFEHHVAWLKGDLSELLSILWVVSSSAMRTSRWAEHCARGRSTYS
jgi:hypothetical protein